MDDSWDTQQCELVVNGWRLSRDQAASFKNVSIFWICHWKYIIHEKFERAVERASLCNRSPGTLGNCHTNTEKLNALNHHLFDENIYWQLIISHIEFWPGNEAIYVFMRYLYLLASNESWINAWKWSYYPAHNRYIGVVKICNISWLRCKICWRRPIQVEMPCHQNFAPRSRTLANFDYYYLLWTTA